MHTIEQLLQMSKSERDFAYRQSVNIHNAMSCDGRDVVRPNRKSGLTPDDHPLPSVEFAYQTACAVMAGIWDDHVLGDGYVGRTSDLDAQKIIEAAVAARKREIS